MSNELESLYVPTSDAKDVFGYSDVSSSQYLQRGILSENSSNNENHFDMNAKGKFVIQNVGTIY